MSTRSDISTVAWNIIEATYVIHVAPSPPQPTKTPIQSESSRVDKHPSSNLRYSSSVCIQILVTALTSWPNELLSPFKPKGHSPACIVS